MELTIFFNLATLFESHHFHLWMIGGSSRDYLLALPFEEFDLVTDATPSQMKMFLPEANYRFAHYGTIKLFVQGVKVDITTLRRESNYEDLRHPNSIQFVTDLSVDVHRRDFTLNAIYLDRHLVPFDFVDGVNDLKDGVIRMIGNPYVRLQEDPIRILRALRFHHRFGFTFEPLLLKALIASIHFVDLLNPQKRLEEFKKMSTHEPLKAKEILMSFGLKDIPF
jgi:poly(A) polymerase/tRNA nucleotidyltransferase (CCA-adding enzyme)